MNWKAFTSELQKANIQGRALRIREAGTLLFVNYYNLPEVRTVERRGGGAEAENNRAAFTIVCLGPDRFRLEHSVNAIKTTRLRGRTGTATNVSRALATYLETVANTVDPLYTHGAP